MFWGEHPEFAPQTTPPTALNKAATRVVPKSQNIAVIEAYAIIWGFEVLHKPVSSWLISHNLMWNQVDRVWATDNQNCEWSFRKARSNQPDIHRMAQQLLHSFILPLGIHIHFPYIPSKINFEADTLSRIKWLVNEWALAKPYYMRFKGFCRKWKLPIPTMDALASQSNAKTNKYHSKYWDVNSCGNFFKYADPKTTYWCCPPMDNDFIEALLTFIVTKALTAWVVLPCWPSSSWWFRVEQAVASYDLKFVKENGPFAEFGFRPPSLTYSPAWLLTIFLFRFSQDPNEIRTGGNQDRSQIIL